MKMKFGRSLLSQYKTYLLMVPVTLIVAICSMVGAFDARTNDLLLQIAYTMIMVVSLNLVVGFLGELSLGHAGFMYIGAVASAMVLHYGQNVIPSTLLRFLLAVLFGGAMAMVFGFIVGLPALRLRGDYLAIVTLAFGEIVRNVFHFLDIKGFTMGGGKIDVTGQVFVLKPYMALIAFCFVLLTLFVVQNLIRSKHGRAIIAIKDNEIAARAMGVNITYYKLMVFAIAACFAGFAGALLATRDVINYTSFDYNKSIEILVMVVLGGMGSTFGSLISATVITFLNFQLDGIMPLLTSGNPLLAGRLAAVKNLIYALILITMMIITASPKLKPLRDKMNWSTIGSKLFRKKKAAEQADKTDSSAKA